MQKKDVFFCGIPTDSEIKKLSEMWPESEMKQGDKYTYEDVEIIIGCGKKSSRFFVVTTRWRKIVEEKTGHVIGVDKGEGFKILTESEKLELSRQKLKESGRRARRSIKVLSITNRKQLSESEKADYDHQQLVGAKVVASAQLRRKVGLPAV